MALKKECGPRPRAEHVGVVDVRPWQTDARGRPVGVDVAEWDAAREEMLCRELDESVLPTRPMTPEDLAYWSLVADVDLHGTGADDGPAATSGMPHQGDVGHETGAAAGLDGHASRERRPGLPAEELAHGLAAAARGLARAGLTEDESVRVLDTGIRSGLESLDAIKTQTDARLVLLTLQADDRGLHTDQGLSLVDWLRLRCPWLPPQDATGIAQVVRCAKLPSGGPVKDAAITGAAPLHRCAMIARTLNRIVRCVDVDQHEGYAGILAAAAANRHLSDPDLARACATLIRDLLDDPPGREKAAEELRSISRRKVGEGLTRFTIDAPDAAAATLDGIITSKLAAPAPTTDEDGQKVLDPRSAGQRGFDALMTVVNRGLSNPGAPPSTARAAVLLVIPFDPATGRPSGVAFTPSGLLVREANASKLACSGDITPVFVGPGNEPLALGDTARYATPGQFKALVVRDRHCSFPGCTRLPQWCDTHHLQWWSRGGHTDVDQMALLCEQHHTHVHQQEIRGEVVGGHVVWHV